MSPYAAIVNATEYPPAVKHSVICDTFDRLKTQEAMLLINDHDPLPLRFQFQSIYSGSFTWEYIEQGPVIYQIKIGKI